MRFVRFLSIVAAAAALCRESFGADDNRFFLVDQRTQIPVMCCALPADWLAAGKTTWHADMSNPISWYVWTRRPDGRAKIIVSSQQVLGSPGAIAQVQMLQDPRVLAQMYLEIVKSDHYFTELQITDAKFLNYQVTPELMQKRQRQALEHGVRLTNLLSAELFIRYDGYAGGEKRVLYVSLPMLIAESQASSMSRTTLIEIMQPMSFSCPESDAEATRQTLLTIIRSLQINPQFIQMVNYIVSRRVGERMKVEKEIREKQMEVARSGSETQDRVRDMWSEYIRGVNSVSNPNTGEKMFVDNRYDHAWINSDNEVMYQNSASFNPNEDQIFNRTRWQKLK